jgi:hypothetical protein
MSRYANAELTGATRNNYEQYFDDPHTGLTRIGAEHLGESQRVLRDGYSFVPHQDAPDPVAYTQSRRSRKGGGFDYGEKQYIYERVETPTAQAAEAAPEPTPEPPVRDEETVQSELAELNTGRDLYDDTRLDRPENNRPRFNFSDDPYKDAIGYGDDLNAHYENRFIPSLRAEAEQTSREIGFSGRNALNDFVGKVPQLGDPKDLFTYYSDQLNQSA